MLDIIRKLNNEDLSKFLWVAYEEANSRGIQLPYESHLTASDLSSIQHFHQLFERIDLMLNPEGYSDDPDFNDAEDRNVFDFLQLVIDNFHNTQQLGKKNT